MWTCNISPCTVSLGRCEFFWYVWTKMGLGTFFLEDFLDSDWMSVDLWMVQGLSHCPRKPSSGISCYLDSPSVDTRVKGAQQEPKPRLSPFLCCFLLLKYPGGRELLSGIFFVPWWLFHLSRKRQYCCWRAPQCWHQWLSQ